MSESELKEFDSHIHVHLFIPCQELSQSLNQTEEAKQLLVTAKIMLEALQQTIDLLKDAELSETDLSSAHSVEDTPPPWDLQESRRAPMDAVE